MRTFLVVAALAALACRKSPPPPFDATDIPAAVAAARAGHKRILITVDGADCVKCRALDAVYAKRPALAALRDKNFVVLAARVAIEKLPAPGAPPHLYVLDENGSLINSESASKLEKDGVYDLDKIEFFLKAFGPPQK